ncbi:MAG: hypothetical protein HRU38_26405 [Saccharospirillaceae bacterium]|nr:hypothetical protein [Saccharospirillaceae bacterium]
MSCAFLTGLKNIDDSKSEVAVNAMYYYAICGLALFNIDAENLLIDYDCSNPVVFYGRLRA